MASIATGEFTIKVATHSRELATETVTVQNTPWAHFTQLSRSHISAGHPVTVCVTVYNVGGPSEFVVVGHLYDATSYEISTLQYSPGGWWPGMSWGAIRHAVWQKYEHNVASNSEFSVEFAIPGEQFVERHLYILETYAVKKLPYLEFPAHDWSSSRESWRARDQPHYSAIVVLAP